MQSHQGGLLKVAGVVICGLLLSSHSAFSAPPKVAPEETPFTIGVQVAMDSPDTQVVDSFTPAIPVGKQFVAQYVNGRAVLPNDQVSRFIVFIGGRQLHFAPTFVGRDFTLDNFMLSESIYMPHAPGEQIRLNMTRFPGNSGTASASVTISGYLVDAP